MEIAFSREHALGGAQSVQKSMGSVMTRPESAELMENGQG
jgi:hypothetical protein